MKAPQRNVFDRGAFDQEVRAAHFLSALAWVEMAVLDLPGQHRQRADLIRVTREWLDQPATIPVESAERTVKECRARAFLIAAPAGPFWERLAEVVEARARYLARTEPVP